MVDNLSDLHVFAAFRQIHADAGFAFRVAFHRVLLKKTLPPHVKVFDVRGS